MRPAYVCISGLLRQVALASQRVAPSATPGFGAAGPAALPCPSTTTTTTTTTSLAPWLASWLSSPFGSSGTTLISTRGLSSRTQPPPDFHSIPTSETTANAMPTFDDNGTGPVSATATAHAFTGGAAPPRHQHPRAKSARVHLRPPSGPPQPPHPRGPKDKAPKVPSAKAAAAMAAVKAGGGQQPLAREARLQLDAQLAEMPLLPSLPYRDRTAAGAAAEEGPRTVHVTGFYTGHPFTRASAEAIATRLRNQPLASGISVARVYHDHEDALIILTATNMTHGSAVSTPRAVIAPGHAPGHGSAAAPAPHTVPPAESPLPSTPSPAEAGAAAAGATAATAAAAGRAEEGAWEGAAAGDSPEDKACMAVMLLEYGGVVFFNIPESLHVEALARVAAAAALADTKPTAAAAAAELTGLPRPWPPLPPPPPSLRGGGSSRTTADAEAWRQAVAEKLCLHKEEQLIVVEPSLMSAGRGTARWIRKLDDSLQVWAWDSTNLESIARVLSQSAAIRYYNQECEDMLERYETIMPLGYEEPPQEPSSRLISDRLLFWRSRLPLRDLRQMVFKSSGIRVRLDSRLGLRDPPSGTWESARHHAVWEAMRQEFELDERRDTLMGKTDLLKQSCLDLISANNESFTKRSELSIILLISFEIFISLTDLHSVLSADNVARVVDMVGEGLGLQKGI